MVSLDFADAISQDVRGAVQYLNKYTEMIGVAGFCMGGALALVALSAVLEFTAGVVWYGFPLLDRFDASGIMAPIQAHWATLDAFLFLLRVWTCLRRSLPAVGSRRRSIAILHIMPLPMKPQ